MRFFWITQLMSFIVFTVDFIMDQKSCTKTWNRASDLCFYIIFFFAFIAVYPYLCRIAEVSAHYAYQTHKKWFKSVLVVILISLVLRMMIVSCYLGFDTEMSILQWTNFIDAIVIICPMLIYTFLWRQEEDCLTCFNRH